MDEVAQRWTSRKFWAMMVWETVFVVMRWQDVLPVEAFVTLTGLLLGGYYASNVGQKVFTKGE